MAVLLITLSGVGSVLAAWAMYDPHKHHPYRIALNNTLDWARSGKDRFDPQYSPSEKECSLKITRIEFFWDHVHEEHSHATRTMSVSRAGEWVRASYTPESRILESRGKIPAEALAAIASELSSLPPSDDPIPLGDTVVILGYLEHGVWMTRIYEGSRLGPRVKWLADIVGLDLK
jgi:hypothetical protein